MKINEKKSGYLRILKRKGKTYTIENELSIPEVEEYKYLGIVISQSLKLRNHISYIKIKTQALKRRIKLLSPSLVNMKTRMILYKTIVIPQLTYACDAIYDIKQQKYTSLGSALYQCLKSLLHIRANVSKEKLFNTLHLKLNEKKLPHFDKLNIIELLSIKAIKLRAGCLFLKRSERL